jgi:hypothetical protein
MTRALLEQSSITRKYYGEAMKTAVYVDNRLIHGKESKSPFELVYGSSSRIDKIRKFGSVCYAFIPSEQRDKLAPLRDYINSGKQINNSIWYKLITSGLIDEVRKWKDYS